MLDAVPVVRALAAAGETQLLARTTESIRGTPNLSAKNHTALVVGEGLLALAQGDPGHAVERLETAVERERNLGQTFGTACLELDLARALEATGQTAAAQEVRARGASVLEPLGCVNPF